MSAPPSDEELELRFEISRLVEEVREKKYKRVALQLPDEIMPVAPFLYSALAKRSKQAGVDGVMFFVLGDTQHGACCVDVIAADHYAPDCLVHFGHACLTPTADTTLPVLFVFDKKRLGEGVHERLVESVCSAREKESGSLEGRHLLVLGDTDMQMCIPRMASDLKSRATPAFSRVFVAMAQGSFEGVVPEEEGKEASGTIRVGGRELFEVVPSSVSHSSASAHGTGEASAAQSGAPRTDAPSITLRRVPPPCPDSEGKNEIPESSNVDVVFLGSQSSPLLSRFLLEYSSSVKQVLLLSASPGDFSSSSSSPPSSSSDTADGVEVEKCDRLATSLVMKRYRHVEACKGAGTIGIVSTAVNLRHSAKLQRALELLCKRKGKIPISIVVGKVNPAKLENFSEPDVFCLLACPEESLLDTKEFRRPVVSPFEILLALEVFEWEARVFFDFGFLLLATERELERLPEEADEEEDTGEGTGGETAAESGQKEKDKKALVPVDATGRQIAVKDRKFLDSLVDYRSRLYQGVSPVEGTEAVDAIQEGRHGVASAYNTDAEVQQ
uniref:2-(3-amino-3-carboxypropyl)histidine synthase n=1 Tax=Chromera velia CCMP2878 TaxID=1169474 RepID=A0A0G4HRQ6_9ALVE|eukprot:Cvel_8127.t1-p1 / transcript=Cvel_8127.t1 / gene=Cvel_8127 / organism=Chromera_velia_CCMP2878 / gene_product=Diphthamide biosynthesis protein 2, putative / transcript_product=Diphthamide biosynthesis protein 2, putative / location=Cvel_scaffold442:17621-22493(-) / protein_length=555 / sequence_SO=supercontig / SO=protein_coding / is_pseudo=false